ncbi:MAG: M3 family oligoendopeptidase, partial [Actinomycetota bacterium]
MTGPTGAEGVSWDLADIYEGPEDPRLATDVEEANSCARQFRERYRGRVAALGAEELAAAVAELERLESLMHRAQAFAYLRFATDTADPARGALLQQMEEHAAALRTEVLFFGLEWVALEDDAAERLLARRALGRHRHHLASQRRYRPHLLSEPEEKLMAEKQLSGAAAWSRLFTELTSALRPSIGPNGGEEVS